MTVSGLTVSGLTVSGLIIGASLATIRPACYRCNFRPCPRKLHAISAVWNHRMDHAADTADILVIDDDPIMRDLVSDWLEAAGYRVRRAADCAAGLAEIGLAAPALVVTDMCMPGASGTLAIARLKWRHPRIRVIAISGHFESGEGPSAEAALRAGAARAFAKPVRRGDIVGAVAELIGPPAS